MYAFRRTAVLAAAATAVALLATACGPDGDPAPAAQAPTTPNAPATSAGPAGAAPTAPGTSDPGNAASKGSLATVTSPQFGPIVVDGLNYTLYRFDKDTAKPSASNCNDACAAKWPPVPVSEQATVKGVDAKLVGSVTRADGTKQLTLNGWPLYRFAEDKAPGETKGQGVGGTWFISTPDGKKAQAAQPTGGSSY
ncbi:hypothetical protein OG535_01435 [Kitasatospora sp. NBC_00085]|uniref:hypothetical protein n=1 Tax=unclassified Kitasatospora TaxID=2633591 RepID=UPI002F90C96B